MKTKLFLTMMLLSLCFGCGRKGPLMPPEALVPAMVADLAAMQAGSDMRLVWSAPAKEKGGRQLRDLAGFRLYRRLLAGDGNDCAACPDSWDLLATIDAAKPSTGDLFVHFDRDLPPGRSGQYRLVAYSRSGGISGPAASTVKRFQPAQAAPACSVTPLPASIGLQCQPSPGKNQVGFNVYRRTEGEQAPLLPLNAQPIRENAWEDLGVTFGQTYRYRATALVEIDGETVESLPSPETTLTFERQDIR